MQCSEMHIERAYLIVYSMFLPLCYIALHCSIQQHWTE